MLLQSQISAPQEVKNSCYTKPRSSSHVYIVPVILCHKCDTHTIWAPEEVSKHEHTLPPHHGTVCCLLHTFTELLSYTSRCRSPYPTSLIMHTKKGPHLRFGSRRCCSLVLLCSGCPRGKRSLDFLHNYYSFFHNYCIFPAFFFWASVHCQIVFNSTVSGPYCKYCMHA